MTPSDDNLPGDEPKMKGFDPARKPRAVRMKDPKMAGRRARTREGRDRKRVREQRPKLLLILGSGLVLITLMGLTAWNILSRKAEVEARIERSKMAPDTRPDLAPDATPEVGAKAVLPEDRAEVDELANPPATPPAIPPAIASPVKITVSEQQRSLESARDRYLARPVAGSGDSESAAEGKAEVDPDSIDKAEKERVLRQVMPFYRSPKESDAPPVPAEEIYIPKPK